MELRIYSPTAILGYGFPRESLQRAVRDGFDAIAVDGGSADPGPYYLGSGELLVPEEALRRDLELLVEAALDTGAPLIIGSAGGAGSRMHVDRVLSIVEDVVRGLGSHARIGYFYSDAPPEWLRSLEPSLEPASPHAPPPDTGATVAAVFQAGVEPFIHLLEEDADIVVGGRSVDPAPFAALPWMKGADKGLAIHMGKILECGALAAEPATGSDGMMGVISRHGFTVYPVNKSLRATVASVWDHALYERRDPYTERVPGGRADMRRAVYEEDGRGVWVSGTLWVDEPYRVKVEGVRLVGWRVIVIAASRDPDFISRLERLLEEAQRAARRVSPRAILHVRLYGVNGVLGDAEPLQEPAHEVAVLLEAVAPTLGEAKAAAATARARLLHAGWPGRKTTSGNLAFPLSPSDVPAGRVYEWSIWHLAPVEPPGPVEYGFVEV